MRMLQMTMDLHTHTKHSHGRGTVFENARAANNEQLKILGICEHGPLHLAYPVTKYDLLKSEAEFASQDGLTVLPGVECNLLSPEGDIDYLAGELKMLGYHRMFRTAGKRQLYFMVNSLARPQSMKAVMTDALIRAVERYDIDALTHPGRYAPIDIKAVAAAAAARGTALEINESAPMSVDDIAAAAEQGARFIASSDAHRMSDVGRFVRCSYLIQEAGVYALTVNALGYAFDAPLWLNRLEEMLG